METRAWNEPDAIDAVLEGCPLHVRGPVDAYVMKPLHGGRVALSTDHISANQAFPGEDVRSLVRRGLLEAISDLAATGAQFHGVQVDLRAPGDFLSTDFLAVGQGLHDVLEEFGGQLLQASNMSRGELGVSNTVVGVLPESVVPMTRTGACPGDEVYLSGPTGGWNSALAVLNASGTGLSQAEWCLIRDDFVDYKPELHLGQALAASGMVNACTDANDSLDKCLRDLVRPLGLDAVIDESAVPLSRSAGLAERVLSVDPRELSIMGLAGDNRLVLTAPPENADMLLAAANALQRRLFRIGYLQEGTGVVHYQGLTPRSTAADVRAGSLYSLTFKSPIALRPERFEGGGRVFATNLD